MVGHYVFFFNFSYDYIRKDHMVIVSFSSFFFFVKRMTLTT